MPKPSPAVLLEHFSNAGMTRLSMVPGSIVERTTTE
jgi:hypothetical protein